MLNLNTYRNYPGLNPFQRNLLGAFNNLDVGALPYANPTMMDYYNSNPTISTMQAMNMFKTAGYTDAVPWSKVLEKYPANNTNTPWYKTTAGVMGIASGGMSLINSISQDFTMGQMYSASASAYRSQARLALQNIETENAYLNEQGAQQIWNLADQKAQFKSEQMMAWAGSGFSDISTGDRRILNDTEAKFASAAAGIRRSMFLQNFENWRSGMMEYSRLQYAAEASERMEKAAKSPFRIAGNLANATLSGLGTYAAFGGKFGKMNLGRNALAVKENV